MSDLPPLDYRDLDGKHLELLHTFTFMGITVPAGFVCDGQSWGIGEKRAGRAAFLHDWLYRHNGKVAEGIFDRWDCDTIFRDALIATGVNPARAWIRWAGLRLGGWMAWLKHKRKK